MLEILLISAGAVLVFVLLGLLELRRMGPSLYGWYVVAGLTLGMLGDLLLALRFLSEKLHRLFFAAGSVSFFLGHIVYILAILALRPAAWLYAIPIAVVALGAACFYAYAKEVRVVLSFGKNDSPYRNAVLHVLYYMAQIFIALTIKFV